MNKLYAGAAALVMAVGLTACGGDDEPSTASTPEATTEATSKPTTRPSAAPTPTETGLNPVELAVCEQYDKAMFGPAADGSTGLRKLFEGQPLPSFLYLTMIEDTKNALDSLPDLVSGTELAVAIAEVNFDIASINAYVTFYDSGTTDTLDIAEPYQAMLTHDANVQKICAG